MAVVRNLMIRIGTDYSAMRQGMQGATQRLNQFRRDAERATTQIKGKKGLGGINTEFKNLSSNVSSSLSRLRGAKGVGGVVGELKNLQPVLGSAVKGLKGFGGAAVGAGATLSGLGLAVAAVTGALALLSAGIYQASQAAVKYEADLGRLNMQLRGNSREFMEWARSVGLAKTEAVELGSTYSVLLSSFISDNKELLDQTKQLTQTSRVVASATGRSLEDVLERMRSGLLGNTEAIEDLGIFVNVAMIESTKAFRKFANGKTWDQLDFRVQQQIRLAAILEQAYSRYGNELQKNVMTKQNSLIGQLKDIKLNLSQAFLPIWDAILPALTRFAEGIANITEQIARFMYSLRGWDYDEMTRGTDKQTDAVDDQGKAYDDLAGSVKKARNELASFDRLNLIGEQSGDASGGGGGTGGFGGPSLPAIPNEPIKIGFEWDIPDPPKVPPIEIPPPTPPDAGMGAVATAVTSTVNQMAAETQGRFANLWQGIHVDTLAWSPSIQSAVASVMTSIAASAGVNTESVRLVWKAMLKDMLGDLNVYRPSIESGWQLLLDKIGSIKNPLAEVRSSWKETLGAMHGDLDAYRPYLEWGWHLISIAVLKPINPLANLKVSWRTALEDMYQSAAARFGGIVSEVNRVIQAISNLRSQLNMVPKQAPTPEIPSIPARAIEPAPSPVTNTGRAAWVDNAPILGDLYRGLDWLRDNVSKPLADVLGPYIVPGGGLAGAGSVIGGSAAKAGSKISEILNALKGLGIPVPQFAAGGIVTGPTLAMIGEYPGAASNPEVIAPLSDLETMLDTSRTNELLARILRAIERGQNVTVTISRNEVGQAATDYINDEARRGRNPLPAL